MQFVTTFKKVWPNLKQYYEIFLSEFYESGKQKLPSLTNDWENCSWSWYKNLFLEKCKNQQVFLFDEDV